MGFCCAVWGLRTFKSAFGFSYSQVACLLEGGEGFVDAADGNFVRMDVEVADCVVNQLSIVVSTLLVRCGRWQAHRCRIFVEQHCKI